MENRSPPGMYLKAVKKAVLKIFKKLPKKQPLRWFFWKSFWTQSAFTCSKLTIETVEQDVKYVQS